MKIYTRTGDYGKTSLSGGKRVTKNNVRIEACGTIDELVSWIGLLKAHKQISKHKEFLFYIQKQLMTFIALLASENYKESLKKLHPDPRSSEKIEKKIDKIQTVLPPLKEFIIPGGNILVSYCHIARCVCRRAERRVCQMNETEEIPVIIFKFLNRLSDYLFVLSRLVSLELDNEEYTWPE
ncbi:MAG: cob(I)yrinic acid a,c-diamide adenosyltransferase [Bacteroidales bacterium]|nr:cob(I)yrinic acid a,c-diamide adenosyltransferase [Bacteroidales bacterium]